MRSVRVRSQSSVWLKSVWHEKAVLSTPTVLGLCSSQWIRKKYIKNHTCCHKFSQAAVARCSAEQRRLTSLAHCINLLVRRPQGWVRVTRLGIFKAFLPHVQKAFLHFQVAFSWEAKHLPDHRDNCGSLHLMLLLQAVQCDREVDLSVPMQYFSLSIRYWCFGLDINPISTLDRNYFFCSVGT